MQKKTANCIRQFIINSNSNWLQINFQTSLSIDNKLFLLSVKLAQKWTVKIKAKTSSVSSSHYFSMKYQLSFLVNNDAWNKGHLVNVQNVKNEHSNLHIRQAIKWFYTQSYLNYHIILKNLFLWVELKFEIKFA